MNFPLKNIELHIPEAELLVGERLFEENLVTKLKELERNLWLAEVEENEVEVQITPGKVRAVTCECAVFNSREMCGHVTAVLFNLRRIVSERKEIQQTRKLSKSLPRKLTTGSILDNITEEELISFVKSYAKADRKFSLALKARFASSVPMLDSRQKYTQLIESTISTHRLKNDLINYHGYRQLKKLGAELIGQANDAFALDNFVEGVIILQCIIEKITPIIHKVKGDGEDLGDFVRSAFMRLEKFINDDSTPDLREDIWNFCITESPKIAYHAHDFGEFFYQLLLQLADTTNKINLLMQLADNELVNKKISNNLKASLLFVKLNLLEKKGKRKAAEKFILDHVANPDFALFVVQKTLREKEYDKAKQFAENALRKSVPKEIRQELEEAMFKIFVSKKNAKKIVEFGLKRLIVSRNISYFKTIKQHHIGDWAALYESIMTSIKSLPFSVEKRDLLAEIYVEENRLEELLDYINRFQSLDILQGFDKYLFPKHREAVESSYFLFLSNYLENHVGRKPSAKVQKVLSHLQQTGEQKFAIRLIKSFQKQFSARQSLMEALNQV